MKFPQYVEELAAYINSKLPDDKKIEFHEDDINWFVAMFEARSLLDSCTTKGIASMLQGGCKPINEEYILEWLQTHVQDFVDDNGAVVFELTDEIIEECGIDPFETLDQHIAYMYNVEVE